MMTVSLDWIHRKLLQTMNVKNTLGVSATLSATSVSSYGALQPSSSEGVSDESNPMILSSSTERSPPPFAKRVFVGSEMYRSLTPLNMECNSSDESSAFSTLIKEEEGHQDLSLPTHSTSTNGHGQLHLGGSDEVVFRPSAPRGPLAKFVAETNGLRSDETSLDMIRISLKDSKDGYSSSSVDEERQKTRSDNTNEITTTTMISDNVQHLSSAVAAPEQDLKSMGEAAAIQLVANAPSDSDTADLDNTLIDSELPSLPMDDSGLSERSDDKTEDTKDLPTSKIPSGSLLEQKDFNLEPISLSDIQLEEDY
jgi:hypothetical protein